MIDLYSMVPLKTSLKLTHQADEYMRYVGTPQPLDGFQREYRWERDMYELFDLSLDRLQRQLDARCIEVTAALKEFYCL